MSHLVTVKLEIKNRSALEKACKALGFEFSEGSHRLYSGNVDGLAVKLPNWNYPAVVNITTGEVKYDNYSERWGKQIELDRLAQRYVQECACEFATQEGYTVTETNSENGEVQLLLERVVG